MSMFDKIFATSAAPVAPAADPNATVVADKGLSAPNPSVGADGKLPDGTGTPVNPLDAYKKMYEDANKSTDLVAPSFKIDPKVLGEVSASMDFTRGVQPELMEKALAGDTTALLGVIQAVGRSAYQASLEHGTALTETHLGQRGEYEGKRVDKGVRDQLTTNALSDAPNYSHPVVKAELNRVASMFAASNPDASPQQIAKAAQEHLQALSAALAPGATAAETSANAPMDWSKYLA